MTVSIHRNRSCIRGHSKYKRSRLIHRIPVEPEQEGGTKELISENQTPKNSRVSWNQKKYALRTLWLLYIFIPFPWRKQQKASKVFPSQNKVYSVSAPATSLPVNSAGNSSIDDSKLLTMTVSMHRNRSCIQGHSKYKRSRLIHRIPVEPEQEGGTKELISENQTPKNSRVSWNQKKYALRTLWLLYIFIPFPWRKQQKASKVFPSQNKVSPCRDLTTGLLPMHIYTLCVLIPTVLKRRRPRCAMLFDGLYQPCTEKRRRH